MGVSTSTKPSPANHWRIAACRRARACRLGRRRLSLSGRQSDIPSVMPDHRMHRDGRVGWRQDVPDDTLPMTPRQIDAFCRRLPAATRIVQWEGVIVFKVGGKMFCLIAPDDHSVARVCFKCPPEHYETLSSADGF